MDPKGQGRVSWRKNRCGVPNQRESLEQERVGGGGWGEKAARARVGAGEGGGRGREVVEGAWLGRCSDLVFQGSDTIRKLTLLLCGVEAAWLLMLLQCPRAGEDRGTGPGSAGGRTEGDGLSRM